jgi:hypothetical protein
MAAVCVDREQAVPAINGHPTLQLFADFRKTGNGQRLTKMAPFAASKKRDGAGITPA